MQNQTRLTSFNFTRSRGHSPQDAKNTSIPTSPAPLTPPLPSPMSTLHQSHPCPHPLLQCPVIPHCHQHHQVPLQHNQAMISNQSKQHHNQLSITRAASIDGTIWVLCTQSLTVQRREVAMRTWRQEKGEEKAQMPKLIMKRRWWTWCCMPVAQTQGQKPMWEDGRTCENSSRKTSPTHTNKVQDSPQLTSYFCCTTLQPFGLREVAKSLPARKLPSSGMRVKVPTSHIRFTSLHTITNYMSSSLLRVGEATGNPQSSMMNACRVLHLTGYQNYQLERSAQATFAKPLPRKFCLP